MQFLRFYQEPDDAALRWLLLVAKRCAWQITRRRRERDALAPQVSADVIEEEAGLADSLESRPEQRALRAEEVKLIARAIAALKPDERAALLLFGLGYSYREIGRMRAWSLAKVERCIKQGRAKVRDAMGKGPSS